MWRFITAPEQVAACMPGCQSVEALSPTKHKITIKVQVGPIKTTFVVDVEVTEERPPEFSSYVTTGEEGGRASRIRAESSLALKAVNDRQTEVHYTSDINIVGRLGKFGLGMMQKIADSMNDEFVAALRGKLEGAGGEVAVTAAVEPARKPTSLLPWIIGAGVLLSLLWLLLR
ncbi:MAG: hypothetical protein A3H91_15320 [Gammaproteobacteria bacterium RIFCSPLOWO2_02_FULL_61_13]|nr:MAG: hypothetical protein A3H91_15320 [Gammaproteobacteria bacterium RIFCSPLOWO2_02_FULL_61_13]